MEILNNFIIHKIKNKKVISLGVAGYEERGYGQIRMHILKKYASKWYGMDNNKEFLLKNNKSKNLFYGNLNKFNYYNQLPKNIDIIIITEVLEHLESPTKTLRYIIKNKKPSTKILISVPNGGSFGKFILGFISNQKLKFQDLEHLQLYNEQTLYNLCQSAGLKNIKIYPYVQTKLRYYFLKYFKHLASGYIAVAN